MLDDATIYASATATGRAGVAVLRISGPACAQAAAHLGMALPAPRRAALEDFKAGPQGETIDQGLALFFPGPHSFTGEDVLELHCHGSPAVLRALMEHLSALPGLRLAEPGEFTRRAYANGKMDLTAAEGLADLIQAESDAQRRQALRQLSGAHRQLFESMRSRILHALALLEACLDFADEDIPADLPERMAMQMQALEQEIEACLTDWKAGERVREGWQIVILGRPNAGKSSLLNALTKREAALVSALPGTTRDVIETSRLIDGQAVIFLDTAGLRETEDAVERMGVDRARERAAQADLCIIVMVEGEDAAQILNDLDLSLTTPTLLVYNKTDIAPKPSPIYPLPDGWSECHLSVLTGRNLDAVERWIATTIGQILPSMGNAIITRGRHREALREALDELRRCRHHTEMGLEMELQSEHLRRAAMAVGKITGAFTSDDVLGLIFSEFCIGK